MSFMYKIGFENHEKKVGVKDYKTKLKWEATGAAPQVKTTHPILRDRLWGTLYSLATLELCLQMFNFTFLLIHSVELYTSRYFIQEQYFYLIFWLNFM